MWFRDGTRLALAAFTLALSASASDSPPEPTNRGEGAAASVTPYAPSGKIRQPRPGDATAAVWDDDDADAAHRASIRFRVLARDFSADRRLQLFELRDDVVPPEEWRDRILWRSGRKWVLEMDAEEAARWTTAGYTGLRIPSEPRGWDPRSPTVAYDCSYDPLVDDLIGGTDQAQWLEWIEKLSGVEPVTVDGTEYTVETRYSSAMFSGAPTAKAYDFALQQVQSWHYGPTRIEEHPYDVGSGQTWKNLILTLPGETFPDEIVLLTGHLDSINMSNVMDAPGANDNGTGAATLFEAARLLRQYRFGRTIQIVWFTGEED